MVLLGLDWIFACSSPRIYLFPISRELRLLVCVCVTEAATAISEYAVLISSEKSLVSTQYIYTCFNLPGIIAQVAIEFTHDVSLATTIVFIIIHSGCLSKIMHV